MDVKLRDGLTVGDGGGPAGAGSAAVAAAASGEAGVTSYRARLLPFVDGGDLVDLLARQNTVRLQRRGHTGSTLFPSSFHLGVRPAFLHRALLVLSFFRSFCLAISVSTRRAIRW